ncbi:trans-sulfuration enzyme family protein [Marinicella litoralis]|uniref:Cystathionine gamma-synthase n=1 Tax=Marinicella litoralis TaxID=644220 RepID=A0A4R6XZ93_9GAMM|nr:aminotransferase class I/II-fold pyridoxal phosphate-dependent enzyme [Marinicella litoralis]TDR23607.1 cystathionine gamma-synthase [Marinicella litoralis]
MSKKRHFETEAIQATEPHGDETGSVANAIYPSTTFRREDDGSFASGFIYSRKHNPNRKLLENALAKIEGGHCAFAFASGMAAINTVLQSLKAGNHVIVPDDAYYELRRTLAELFANWHLSHTQVDMTDTAAIKSALQPNTRLIWIESPSNPLLKVTDIRQVAAIAHENNALCVVDNTWCTPVLQRPLELGADAVMYSTTKYFGGHSDSLSGALVINSNAPKEFVDNLANIQNLSGAVPSAFDCWLITRGIKTMKLRIMQQVHNANKLAAFLQQHPKVKTVHFPDLPSHPQHQLAKTQMPQGSGAMLSIQIGETQQQAMAVIARLHLFTRATSLGGVESLVEHRRSVEGKASLTPVNLIRISVGIEHIDDLIDDWMHALS